MTGEQMKTYIKPANVEQIVNFANSKPSNFDGSKLQALYRLIQAKGEPIETTDKNLNGVYCLQLKEGVYVAIKRSFGSKEKFFPCMIKTHLLSYFK